MPESDERIILEVDDDDATAASEKKETQRVLVFLLKEEKYCIDIKSTKEVFKPEMITKVPNTPEFIIGVTNLHGEIIPVIDIRHFLNLALEEKKSKGEARIIVTDVKGSPIGIMVEKVEEARDIEKEAIQPPLATIKNSIAQFTKGQLQIDGKIYVFLDLEKILNCSEIEQLTKQGGG